MASLYVPSRIGSPTGSGYKLYFYQTGTTTPINTYSQSDLAIGHVNTNPVVADSNGLFGPIYLLPTPDYKAVLTDANGTTIWTTDPLLTAAATVITTQGDLIVGNNVGAASRLAIGAAGQYLRSTGATAAWSALLATDLTGAVPKASMPPGSVIQSIVVSTNAYTSHTTVIPNDDTIPLNTEGDQLFTANLTPTSTSSKVRVTVLLQASAGTDVAAAALFRGGGVNAIAAAAVFTSVDFITPLPLLFEEVPGSVATQTYNLRVGPTGNTMYINGNSAGRKYGGALVSQMLLEEIAP